MKSSVNEKVILPFLEEKKVELYLKREDLLHPVISGNKYRKLYYNLIAAKEQGKDTLLTFGGAFSNHIVATAGAGKTYGFKTIGIIRGDELGKFSAQSILANPSLKEAASYGMEFIFIDRETYRQKATPAFLATLQAKYPTAYILPEGGTNALAIKGCEEILLKTDSIFSHITCAMGTGGTVTGIINASLKHQNILIYPSLKGNWIKDEILGLKPNKFNWEVVSDFHFGGYGKISEDLINFVNRFKSSTGISLDPVYTGKMMFGLLEMIRNDFFPENSKILAIHTGGLQGIAGMNQRLKKNKLTLLI